MKYNSASVGYLLLGPYDLRSVSDRIETETIKQAKDTTPLGADSRQLEQPGLTEHSISGHSGWYDSAAASINAAMVSLAAGEHVFMFAYEGNTKGKRVTCAGGTLKAAYKRSPQVGEFTRAEMTLGVSGKMDDARIVRALAAASGNGNSEADYLDLGAAGVGAAGCDVYVSVTALGAGTTLTLTLEDSADHVSWADQTVMTAKTAVGAEKKASTDLTVNRYLAAKHAFSGGTTTATYTMAVSVN